jgi:hypothetical protein
MCAYMETRDFYLSYYNFMHQYILILNKESLNLKKKNKKMEIVWSPFQDNEFILYGNNILFYRINSLDNSISKIS